MGNDYNAFMDFRERWIRAQILEHGQAIMTTMEIADAGMKTLMLASHFRV